MLLINKLKNIEGFSDIEKKLAQFVLQKPQEVIQMNIETFSSENYVSNSTIVRFCQKLGFKGFTDFKITLASEINTFTQTEDRIAVDMPFSLEDDLEDIPKIFMNLYKQSLSDIYHFIDMDKIEKIAKVLDDAQLISLFAQGPSLALALDFHYKIKRVGYPSVIDPLMGFDTISSSKRSEKEVVIIITSYGISDSIKTRLMYHKALGNETIIICLNPSSPYLKLADHKIVLDTFEERLMKLGHFASKTAMGYILDILYASMFRLNYQDNLEKLKESRKAIEETFEQ